MDRIEAIKVLNRFPVNYTGMTINEADRVDQALAMATRALRPVSREQVKKVWRGEWNVSYDELNGCTSVTCSKCGDETVVNGCFVTTSGEPCGLADFCSACGAPMTDEAVQMVMERLEALGNDAQGTI